MQIYTTRVSLYYGVALVAVLALCAPSFGLTDLSASAAVAGDAYSVSVLSTDQSFYPRAANDTGEVVGYNVDQHGNVIPAYFQNGVVTNITVPGPGIAPYVTGISPNGDIPIVSQNPTTSYVFNNGTLLPLLPVSAGTFGAQVVGANGQVAGSYIASDGISSSAAIYHNGQLTFLSGADYVSDSNARGDFLIGSNAGAFILHPDGSSTALPSITDGVYTHISSNGIVIGYRPLLETPPGITPPPAGTFIIANGNLQFYDDPASASFLPSAINSSGTAVGTGLDGAAIFQDGTITPLKQLVSDDSWDFGSPLSISDNGTIYLYGVDEQTGQNDLLELTPRAGVVPEPASLVLLPLAVIGLAIKFRRI